MYWKNELSVVETYFIVEELPFADRSKDFMTWAVLGSELCWPVYCQTLEPLIYSPKNWMYVCLSPKETHVNQLCLDSSLNLRLRLWTEPVCVWTGSERQPMILVFDWSPSSLWDPCVWLVSIFTLRSLCLTGLHLHSEILVTPCVDPFCRKPRLNTRR